MKMAAHRSSCRRWQKALALILAAAFVHQDAVRAAAPDTRYPAIPSSIAVTRESGISGPKTIINIQDAHSSIGAQESIVSILDSLVTDYDLKVVAIEGSSGYIDTSLFRTFPDAKIKKETASALIKEGRMSAAEFFAITSEKPVAVYGVDDEPLYRRNVEEFRSLYGTAPAARRDIDAILGIVRRLKEKAFSGDLKDIDRSGLVGADGGPSLDHRIAVAERIAARSGVDIGKYRSLATFKASAAMERSVDFGSANRERDDLIGLFTKALAGEELKGLVMRSVAFKSGRIPRGEYHSYLLGLAERLSVDKARYAQLQAYTAYMRLYESIDIIALFRETSAFEDEVRERLFADDASRRLYRTARCLALAKAALDLKLSQDDYGYLRQNLSACEPRALGAFLRGCHAGYGLKDPGGYDASSAHAAAVRALGFYETAERRNGALIENTVRRMGEEGVSAAALIAGGFHSRGMAGLMKEKDLSYFVLLPKFDASKGERPYAAILTKKASPYKDAIAAGSMHLATSAYFAPDRSVPEHLRFNAFASDVRRMLDATARDTPEGPERRKRKIAVIAEWAENYSRFYGDFMKGRAARRRDGLSAADFEPRPPEDVKAFLASLLTEAEPRAEARPAKIAIVTANFNNSHHTEAFLKSLEELDYPSYEVIVVDDGSKEPFRFDESRYGTIGPVTVISDPRNEGVSRARNLGISYAISRGCDYVYFADNDTILRPDTLKELEAEARRHPEAGVIGAKEYYFDSPSRLYSAGGARMLGMPRGHNRIDMGQYDRYAAVQAVGSAAILVRREVFERIGGFDEYLYFGLEDAEFCFRASRAGFTIGVCPTANVLHKVGGGMARFSAKRAYHLARNPLLMARRFGGALRLKLIARAFLVSARSFYGIVRSGDLAALGGIWRGIRDGIFDTKFDALRQKIDLPEVASAGVNVVESGEADAGRMIRTIVGHIRSGGDIDNDELIMSVGSRREALSALIRALNMLAAGTEDAIVKARALLMIGRIYARHRALSASPNMERLHSNLAMSSIRSAVGRSIRPPSHRLKIPAAFFASELVVSCPVRVDLSHGGASDLFAISYERGGSAVNIAVDLNGRPPITVRARGIAEKVIRIRSVDLGVEKTVSYKEGIFDYRSAQDPLRLIEAAFVVSGIIKKDDERPLDKILEEMGGGIEIETLSEVPKGSGLGTSSILGVTVLDALYKVTGQERSREELVDAGLYLEQVLGIGGGWQDPVGGIYPGIKMIKSRPGKPMPVPGTIKVSEETARRLEDRMVLYYTGASHFAGDILRKLTEDYITRSAAELGSRKRLAAMDTDMVRALEEGDIDRLGRLLNGFWKEWEVLNPEAGNDETDRLFKDVEDLIAGAKLCGAGGGGFALFIAKEGKKAELEARLRAIGERSGGELYSGSIDRTGLAETTVPIKGKDEPAVAAQGPVSARRAKALALYLKYPDPRQPDLELDAYDRMHYRWDEATNYWRSRDNPRLVLGTWRDIRRSTKADAPKTGMENHVAIRMRGDYTIYAFDAHSYSPAYLREAASRGEVRQDGNDEIFIDDHPDAGRNCDPNACTVSGMISGGWLANHQWVYFDDIWGRGESVLGPNDGITKSGVVNNGCHYSRYFEVDTRPRGSKAIFNIDTDATADIGSILAFIGDVAARDGVTPSTVHLSTSPSNTEEGTDAYPSELDGLIYPDGFGTVERCTTLAMESNIPRVFAEMGSKGPRPFVIGLPPSVTAEDMDRVRRIAADITAGLAVQASVETFNDGADGFGARLRTSGAKGIYIDKSFFRDPGRPAADLKRLAQTITIETAAVVVGAEDRARIERIMERLNHILPELEKASPDIDLRERLGNLTGSLAEAVAARMTDVRSACGPSYVAGAASEAVSKNGRVAIALTERFVGCDLFSSGQMEEVARNEGISPFLVYGMSDAGGRKAASTREEAAAYLRGLGYSDPVINRIKFIDGAGLSYAEVLAAVSRETGIAAANIGIGAIEKELARSSGDEGFLFEVEPVQVGGKRFYASPNGIETLLRVMAKFDPVSMSLDVPGVKYDRTRRVFRYIPRSIPIDYEKELEIYRRAIELIGKAA